MNRTSRGGLRAALLLLAPALPLLLAGCVSDEMLTRRIHDQDEALKASHQKNDEMRETVAANEKALAAARADVDRLQGRDTAYQEAQARLQERIQELEKSFQAPGGGGEDGGIAIEKIAGGYKFVVQGEVLFGTGEAELTADGKAALGRIAAALKGRAEKVRVEGHTDNVPIVKAETKARYPFGNLDLSLDRALRVADFLMKEGVEAKRVSCGGYGEYQPRAENGTAEGKKKNRRVEILVQAE